MTFYPTHDNGLLDDRLDRVDADNYAEWHDGHPPSCATCSSTRGKTSRNSYAPKPSTPAHARSTSDPVIAPGRDTVREGAVCHLGWQNGCRTVPSGAVCCQSVPP